MGGQDWYYGEGGKPVAYDDGNVFTHGSHVAPGSGQAYHDGDPAPPGYKWENGQLVPLPGTQAAMEADKARRASNTALLKRTTGMGHPLWEADQEAQGRQRQQQALDLLKAQALGQGPSVARIQQAQTSGQALNAANSMGGSNPLAARAAMGAAGQGLLGAYQQGAQGASNEQLGAMNAFGKGTTDLRGSDLDAEKIWGTQAARDRDLQLQNAKQNIGAVQGQEGLESDRYSRLKNANLQGWADFTANQDRADAQAGQNAQQLLSTIMSMFGGMMASDERQKTDVRRTKKGRR